jgi:hypothetical protein
VSATATVNLLNPLPVISSLGPSSINTGLEYTIEIKGTGFVKSSQVMLGGTAVPPKAVRFRSGTDLQLTGTNAAAAGTNLQGTVVNPDPGTATSKAKALTVQPHKRLLKARSWLSSAFNLTPSETFMPGYVLK